MQTRRVRLACALVLAFGCAQYAAAFDGMPCLADTSKAPAPEAVAGDQHRLLALLSARADEPALAAAVSRALQLPIRCSDVDAPPPPPSRRTLRHAERAALAQRDSPLAMFVLASPAMGLDDARRKPFERQLIEIDAGNAAAHLLLIEAAARDGDEARVDTGLAAAATATRYRSYRGALMRALVDAGGDVPPAGEVPLLTEAQRTGGEPVSPHQLRALTAWFVASRLWSHVHAELAAVCHRERARQWSEAREQNCIALARVMSEHSDELTAGAMGMLMLQRLETSPDGAAAVLERNRAIAWRRHALGELQHESPLHTVNAELHWLASGKTGAEALADYLALNGVSTEPPAGYAER